jgi:hypothetical protein
METDNFLKELPFLSEGFRIAWSDWCQFRKEIKRPLTPTAVSRQLNFLRGLTEAQALASIDQSIRSGWTGLFPPAKSITHSQTVNFHQEGGGF